MRATVADDLLGHYRTTARRLPWRAPPGAPRQDPYKVWLSEVMLQQTTVATVTPRFERFVERWPTVEALAAAPDEDILQEWAGLGYYARARNLIACARAVAARGGFPRTEAELRALPGLGLYTAAAIAAIAFGERAVVVDTNVARVVARLFALPGPAEGIREKAAAITPDAERAGDFAQAMMDLGATICRPRAPRCGECPVSAHCVAFALGTPEEFPARKAKAARPHRHGIAWWSERDGALWLVRRPPTGLLGGMAALPTGEWTDAVPDEARRAIAVVRHGFTHFSLDLHLVEADAPVGDGWWQPLERIDEAGLPTLFAACVAAVRSAGGLLRAA
ncbi:A/G-specific adenine glycosylase [Sphingomonas ginkgonis]|uniref:Adenine DNA glycosylase n=1 Tax=Sphingomonas ginkgonis TaxID=2315330 RepID=A0A3S0EKU7_9SPHN|nr:A/G-specific adenine glycosylase [Sphingomonas ginkgonis]RST29948.1 A/G-specific adenine glycosylase [Sphingomonas ginkgonis]